MAFPPAFPMTSNGLDVPVNSVPSVPTTRTGKVGSTFYSYNSSTYASPAPCLLTRQTYTLLTSREWRKDHICMQMAKQFGHVQVYEHIRLSLCMPQVKTHRTALLRSSTSALMLETLCLIMKRTFLRYLLLDACMFGSLRVGKCRMALSSLQHKVWVFSGGEHTWQDGQLAPAVAYFLLAFYGRDAEGRDSLTPLGQWKLILCLQHMIIVNAYAWQEICTERTLLHLHNAPRAYFVPNFAPTFLCVLSSQLTHCPLKTGV